MGAPVYVPVVLETAGMAEQLAALVAAVPPGPQARAHRFVQAI